MKDKLEEILDNCIRKVRSGETTVSECIEAYPQYKEELRLALLATLALIETPLPSINSEFRERARKHLIQAAENRRKFSQRRFLQKKPNKISRGIKAWLIAASLILLLGGAALAASQKSQPGSFLYPVKLAAEKLQLALVKEPYTKTQVHLKFASHRLEELEKISEEQQFKYIDDLTEALLREVNETEKLIPFLSKKEKAKTYEAILKILKREQELLVQIVIDAPEKAQSRLKKAEEAVQGKQKQLKELWIEQEKENEPPKRSPQEAPLKKSPADSLEKAPSQKPQLTSPSEVSPPTSVPPPINEGN
jgi:hypothetical protein